jgi:MoaA/NifB/PqqE/SkfB family radical SAM enzyme
MDNAGYHVVQLYQRNRLVQSYGIFLMIKTLHIEPTTRCTLACPQCPRTAHIDMVKIHDCDISTIVRASAGFNHVHFCGNHGDPIYHPEFHRLMRDIKSSNSNIRISMHTNGAFRSKEWWTETAEILDHPRDSITFSIDGLPTNNHLYRVNSRWSSVLTAINTLRIHNDSLELVWKWIIFRYNETDVAEGMRLAKDLGFDKFLLVKSYRADDDDPLTSSQSLGDIKEQLVAASLS